MPAKFVSCMHEHGVTVNTSGKGQGKSGASSVKAAFAACEPAPHSAPTAPAGAVKPPAPPSTGAPPAAGGSGEAAGGG